MSWCFAILNNKLAEIYFDETKKDSKIWAHCYVKKANFKTRGERKWIEKDTAKLHLVYRKGKYRRVKSVSNSRE